MIDAGDVVRLEPDPADWEANMNAKARNVDAEFADMFEELSVTTPVG
jgi:hypothetical protein